MTLTVGVLQLLFTFYYPSSTLLLRALSLLFFIFLEKWLFYDVVGHTEYLDWALEEDWVWRKVQSKFYTSTLIWVTKYFIFSIHYHFILVSFFCNLETKSQKICWRSTYIFIGFFRLVYFSYRRISEGRNGIRYPILTETRKIS